MYGGGKGGEEDLWLLRLISAAVPWEFLLELVVVQMCGVFLAL